MATLREILYNIKNIVSKGRQSDDFPYSGRQLAFQVNYYRAKLIHEQIKKEASVDNASYIQDLGKVPVKLADAHDCCEVDVCVLRTVEKVPEFLDGKSGEMVTYVGNLDYSRPYQRIAVNRIYWQQFDKYTSKQPRWYYKAGYIYLVNPVSPMLSFINIQGVFTDPVEAHRFRTCDCPDNELPCVDGFDEEYPLEERMIDTLVKLILQTEFNVYLQSQDDAQNDTRTPPAQSQAVQARQNR